MCAITRVSEQNLALIFYEIGELNRNKLEFDSLCRIDSIRQVNRFESVRIDYSQL